MKKMKKLSATLLALLFVLTTVLPVQAANGPNDILAYILITDSQDSEYKKVIFNNGYLGTDRPIDLVSGVLYNKNTNTLTFNNFNSKTSCITINTMGDDFKLNLVGDNHIQCLSIWGDGHGGSVQICGNGSLTVNADKSVYFPIQLRAETANAKITVDNTVTLKVYAPEEHSAIIVDETTVASDGITFTGRSNLNAKVKSDSYSQPKKEYVYLVEENSLRKCTPKTGSGYDETATYGFSVGWSGEDEDKNYEISIYRIEKIGNDTVAFPLPDRTGVTRYFTVDELKAAFDFKGEIDYDTEDNDIRINFIEESKELRKCTLKDGDDDEYLCEPASYLDDGNNYIDVYIVYEYVTNSLGYTLARPLQDEEGGTRIFPTEEFNGSYEVGTATDSVNVIDVSDECTFRSKEQGDNDLYASRSVNEEMDGVQTTYTYVYRIVEDNGKSFGIPLIDENTGERKNYASDFDKHFDYIIPEAAENTDNLYIQPKNGEYAPIYTKKDDSGDYTVSYYYISIGDEDTDDSAMERVYTIYKLSDINGKKIGIPVENGSRLHAIPSDYTAVTGPTYYNYYYPESTLEITGIPAQSTGSGSGQTTTPTQQTTPEAPKQEAAGTELKDTESNATGKVTNPGTVVDGKIVGAEVSYTKATEAKAEVSIPATMKIGDIEYAVTSVEKDAFKGDNTITSVTVGENVKTIDSGAFSNCKNLKTVKIGDKVETIGNNAFAGNSKLTTVTMGNNVTTVGDKAFQKCTSLKKVTIPATVTKVGKDAFSGCTKMTTATIGKNVKSIGANAFSGNKKLKTVTIKSSKVPTIGKNAFKGLPNNATIKVPKKLYKDFKKKLTSKTGFKKTMKLKKV